MLKKYRRVIASFLLITIVSNTLFPTVSLALTGGPTVPEYFAFVPWDNSEMVNLSTGDLNMSIPLLEVLGPEGGYPLSLSYSGGIKTNQEASWVGLGFSLNAGAITRTVNGFADDYNKALYSVQDEWEGGNAYKEGAGLALFGIGIWLEANWSTHSPHKSLDARVMSPYGGIDTRKRSVSLSIDFSKKNNSNTNQLIQSANQSANPNRQGNVGIMSLHYDSRYGFYSDANPPSSPSVSEYNNKGNNVRTEIVDKKRFLIYEYTKTRYWLDETDSSYMVGTLNGKYLPSEVPDNYSFDRYVLGEVVTNPAFDNNPRIIRSNNELMAGPSFPAYDNYTVLSNGLAGAIQPKIFNNPSLFDRKKTNLKLGGREFDVTNVHWKPLEHSPKFRFLGEFSNSLTVNDVSDFDISSGTASINFPAPDNVGFTKHVYSEGFDSDNFQLHSANNIEYFENREIADLQTSGFINYVRPVDRTSFKTYDVESQIGGFSITNTNGVTYHYALPVYAYENYTEYTKLDRFGRATTRKIKNNQPYAYSWLLTSITGADFVDKNNNGTADKDDLGYWVNFVYGKSTSDYKFRMPSEAGDILTDSDGSKVFSYGRKELYYLDAIYTRSHTSLFIKEMREDAKGVHLSSGGFSRFSSSSLRLNEIVLYKNGDLPGSGNSLLEKIDNISNIYNTDIEFTVPGGLSLSWLNSNIITNQDIETLADYLSNSLRRVKFNYDYSLCPLTPNSFVVNYNDLTISPGEGGKLTLTSLQFFGKNNESILPDYQFSYEQENQIITGSIIDAPSALDSSREVLAKIDSGQDDEIVMGDILKFRIGTNDFWGAVVEVMGIDNRFRLKILNSIVPPETSVVFTKTKNPPFNKNQFDLWGYFKSDFSKSNSSTTVNDDLLRHTSDVSAAGVDAWCLREIRAPLGSRTRIDYQSKSYNNIGVKNPKIVNIKPKTGAIFSNSSTEYIHNNHPNVYQGGTISYLKLYLAESDIHRHLKRVLHPGSQVKVVSVTNQKHVSGSVTTFLNDGIVEGNLTIVEVGDDYIKVTDPNNVFVNYVSPSGVAATSHYHFLSYIELPDAAVFGGGVQVSSVTDINFMGDESKTQYQYIDGTTSFEPLGFNSLSTAMDADEIISDDVVDVYKKKFFDSHKRIMYASSELPGPGVIYKSCVVKNFFNDVELPSHSKYSFHVFDDDMFIASDAPEDEYYYSSLQVDGGSHESRTLKLKDYSSKIGKIHSTELFSRDGSALAKTIYEYTHEVSTNNLLQGVTEEVFNEHRIIHPHDGKPDIHLGTVSIRSTYPTVLKGVKEYNYKTGLIAETQNTGFDFYTGRVIQSRFEDGYGNTYQNEITPAHVIYDSMGLLKKGGKNMLMHDAANYVYKINTADDSKMGLLSASVQKWSSGIPIESEGRQWAVWRRHASYSFVGDNNTAMDHDGLYPVSGDLPSFSSWGKNDIVPDVWRKNSAVTRYDAYSNPLEVTDVSEQYSVTKLSSDHAQVLATAINARYDQIAYSGAEDNAIDGTYGGGVKRLNGVEESASHTGAKSLRLSENGQRTFLYSLPMVPGKSYRSSVWVNSSGGRLYYKISNNIVVFESDAPVNSAEAGGWYLLTLDIPSSSVSATLDVWCGTENGICHFDDFRVHPVGAVMTSYVYNKWGELTHILDHNNIFTQYEYDGMGRLYKTYRESFKNEVVNTSKINYHYHSQN